MSCGAQSAAGLFERWTIALRPAQSNARKVDYVIKAPKEVRAVNGIAIDWVW
jgi:hypothetical protein